jgi:hypothetical protein
MNTDELRRIAKGALNDLKREVRTQSRCTPLFRCCYADGRHQDFHLPPGTEHLLNRGEAKEILFDVFRRHTAAGGVVAWIFGTDQWMARATDEGMQHREEWPKYQDHGFVKLQEMGWCVVESAIGITAQTETDVFWLHQVYVSGEHAEFIGPPQEKLASQKDFGGRQKMWGATKADITGAADMSASPDRPVGVELLVEHDA